MLLFTLRRILQTIPTIAAVVLLIFIMFNVIPGSFATGQQDEGIGLDQAVVTRMRAELGLDDPIHVRFGRYIGALATLDMGISFRSRQPVTQIIAARLWPSLKLTTVSMIFAIVVGCRSASSPPSSPAAWSTS